LVPQSGIISGLPVIRPERNETVFSNDAWNQRMAGCKRRHDNEAPPGHLVGVGFFKSFACIE